MDKLDILFIRACKSRDAETRLRSVVRRFYLTTANPVQILQDKLSEICKEVGLMDLPTFIAEMQNRKQSLAYFNYEFRFDDCVVDVLITAIRFASADQLKEHGYVAGLKWRIRKSDDS